jgi:hypothetical protein
MKSKLTLLTLMAVAIFAVQQRSQAQVDLPTSLSGQSTSQFNSSAPEDLNSTNTDPDSHSYSEHVGDLKSFSMFVGDNSVAASELGSTDFASFVAGKDDSCGKNCDGSCGGKGCQSSSECKHGCTCPMCRRDEISDRLFGSVEFLQWWDKGRGVPPLVTTDAVGTAINNGAPNFVPISLTNPAAGVSPDSRLLFGDRRIGGGLQAGVRLTAGLWLDDERSRSVGIRAFGTNGFSLNQTFTSDGTQPLGLTFFNTDPVNVGFGEDAFIIAHTNFGLNRNGSVNVTSQNDFIGGDVLFRSLLDSGCNYRLDALIGYQYARLDDDLLLSATINDVAAGNTFTFDDSFRVKNSYNAASLGAQADIYKGCWTLSMLGKISLGNMRQDVTIAGVNTVNGLQTAGGFYTQPFTNIGSHTRDITVWSPEANFKLGYAFTRDLSLSVGCTFIYWNKMALAGDQIDRNVNATQLSGGGLVGPGDPMFVFNDTDYWIQTIDIGVNWRY